MHNLIRIGSMPEWLKGADCKSAGSAYVGSNPTRPIYEKVFLVVVCTDDSALKPIICELLLPGATIG